jgi:pimeloyl-ACP methyl ester carboxylesterase
MNTPMRRILFVLIALALPVGGALAYGEWKSPESAELDDAARAEAPGEFVSLARGRTHYDLAGPDAGRLVVLVHGFSVPYYIWDSTAVALRSSGYRVLRYDLYGRGFSDRPRGRYDSSLYDGQLEALLDSLEVTGRIDLVALSFGSFVASSFVARHPDRVRTVTFVDPMSGAPEVPRVLRVPLLGSWLWTVSRVPDLPAGQMTDFLHPENHPTWIDRYLPQMRYRGFAHALLSSVLETSRVDFDDLFAGVAETGVPVMLIWGKQDQTVPFAMSEVLLRNIPSAEFVPVDSAGHLPHIEQAAFVNAVLTRFLEAHPERTK